VTFLASLALPACLACSPPRRTDDPLNPIVAPTEVVNVRTAVLMDLAEVLLLGGDAAGAATAAGEALELYERKGNVASAARVQSFLAGLRSGAGAA